ncbi:MAG: hypothetical protein P4L93_11700 [Coriobacteriia bacterium]|nr:hypothetical protein [Coriobacteriia bacterium]
MSTTVAYTNATYGGALWADTGTAKVAICQGAWSRLTFTGTSLALQLNNPSRTYPTEVEWQIDGGAIQRSTISNGMGLASGLTSGTHHAQIILAGNYFQDNQWNTGVGLSITGYTVDTGSTVSAWPSPNPIWGLVLGDSFDCGNLVLGYGGATWTAGTYYPVGAVVYNADDGWYYSCTSTNTDVAWNAAHWSQTTNDAQPNHPCYGSGRLAFSQVLGSSLGCDVITFANGGAGIGESYGTTGWPEMDTAFGNSMAGQTAAWPSTPPSFVLMELGNNDTGETSATRRTKYQNLVTAVRAKWATVPFFGMGYINGSAAFSADVSYVMGNNAGCHYIDASGWTDVPYVNSGHPDTAGQAAIAAHLQATITPYLPATYADFGGLAMQFVPQATYADFGGTATGVPVVSGEYADFGGLAAQAGALVSFADFGGTALADITPTPTLETLRFYKRGISGFTDITSSTLGGFSDLTFTAVRNDAGGLAGSFQASTIAQFHTWANEASKVEYWNGGARQAVYYVDSYTPDWKNLTISMACVGPLVLGKTLTYTGNLVGVTAAQAFCTLCNAVPDWTYNASFVSAGSYVVANLSYTDKPVLEAMQEIADLAGVTFWIDANMALHVETVPATPNYTIQLPVSGATSNGNGRNWTTTHTARDIVNRLIMVTRAGTYTFDDTASHATYGVRAKKLQLAQITSYHQASDYATAYFLEYAQPRLEATASIDHDTTCRPGLFASVLGLSDGRTYQLVVEQTTWALGALSDELTLGAQPLTLLEAPDAQSIAAVTPAPSITVGNMPAFNSYFQQADTVGTPNAPQNLDGALAFKTLILHWDLPPEALWRTYEIYEDYTAGFTPDTTSGNFTNRVYSGDQTVVPIKHGVGEGPFFYKVCSVKSDGVTRSPFVVPASQPTGGWAFVAVPDGELANISANKITAGTIVSGVSISAAGLFGTLDASQITVTNLDAGSLVSGTIMGLNITGSTIRTASSGAVVELGPGVNGGTGVINIKSGSSLDVTPAQITSYEYGSGNARQIYTSIISGCDLKAGGSGTQTWGSAGIRLASADRSNADPAAILLDLPGANGATIDSPGGNTRLGLGSHGYLKAPSDGGDWQFRDASDSGYKTVRALAFSPMSARKLKTAITVHKGALSQVLAAKPHQYRFKADPKDAPKRLGIISDELPAILVNEEGGYDLGGAVALAFGGIQELAARIEALEAK